MQFGEIRVRSQTGLGQVQWIQPGSIFKPFYIPINVKKIIIQATTCSKKIQVNMPVNVMLNIKFLEIS